MSDDASAKTAPPPPRAWPPFRPWRVERGDANALTVLTPQQKSPVRTGVHELRVVTATRDLQIAVSCDDGVVDTALARLPDRDAGVLRFLIWLPPRTSALHLTSPAGDALSIRNAALRRVGTVRLTALIAARKDAQRRRAMQWLLAGAPSRALDLLGAGAEAATAAYRDWIDRHEPPAAAQGARIGAHIAGWTAPPTFTVVMPVYNTPLAFLHAAIESVRAQQYPHWRLVIADDASPDPDVRAALDRWPGADARIVVVRLDANGGIAAATNAALERADGEWVTFLDHDDVLAPDALALVADAIVTAPAAQIVYTDEDKIVADDGRAEPYFKPDWNRELFYAQNYLNHLTAVRRNLVSAAGGLRPGFDGSQDYDLLLRCIERIRDDEIVHVPFVCYHWRFAAGLQNYSLRHGARAKAAAMRALDEHFARTGMAGVAEAVDGTPYWRARWRIADPPPHVTLIIPTRDRAGLLAQAIDSIVAARAAYPHFDILIADNDSADPDTLAYFRVLEAAGNAVVVAAPGPFNFSYINNVAARAARGALLGFINNDVKVRATDWLAEMVSHFARPDVAAVGAKLLYGDGRVQHAGVATGIGGVAGHLHKRRDGADRGPFSHLALAREVTAATAACLLVRAEAFAAVGGFDETDLAVAFNDVDLCLKLRAMGHRIVWTPFAVLDHFESASRGDDVKGPERQRYEREAQAMQGRWGARLDADPYYSPNLTLHDETGALAFPPRVRRPWCDTG